MQGGMFFGMPTVWEHLSHQSNVRNSEEATLMWKRRMAVETLYIGPDLLIQSWSQTIVNMSLETEVP